MGLHSGFVSLLVYRIVTAPLLLQPLVAFYFITGGVLFTVLLVAEQHSPLFVYLVEPLYRFSDLILGHVLFILLFCCAYMCKVCGLCCLFACCADFLCSM